MQYRGLTWDHPRGYGALEAAAARAATAGGGPLIAWDRQPLEGFESRQLEDLAAQYDLLVIDHPHVGEAVARSCLRPMEEVFAAADIEGWQRRVIGHAAESYAWAGRHWAMPLDVATQVMALRPDLLDGPPPRDWDGVVRLASRRPVATVEAGPHAWLTALAICAASGATIDEADLLPASAWTDAWPILVHLHRHAPPGSDALNPIGLLETMACGDDIALVPLVYGYVNYAVAEAPRRPVVFGDAPVSAPGGPHGSVLGGTGLAISRKARVSPALREHLSWLLTEEAQTAFIPAHAGQPAARAAWRDAAVNTRWNAFYRRTIVTAEGAIVRPRHAGYIAFQDRAGALIRDGLRAAAAAGAVLARLRDAWHASRPRAAAMPPAD